MEVLIKWKGLSPMEAMWERFELINQQFLSLYLVDNVTALGLGVFDKPKPQLNSRTQDVKGRASTWGS